MATIYIFKAYYRGAVASAADTPSVLRAFGSLEDFERHFGGSMSFGKPSEPSFLGVWGHRNAARFRRILRDQLGELTILHAAPPARHSAHSVHGHRLSRLERDEHERRLIRSVPRS